MFFVHVFQRKSLKPQNKYKLLPYVVCIIPLYLRWQNCIVCFQSGSSQNIELRIFFYESADLHLWYEKGYQKNYQFRNCFFKTSSVKHRALCRYRSTEWEVVCNGKMRDGKYTKFAVADGSNKLIYNVYKKKLIKNNRYTFLSFYNNE